MTIRATCYGRMHSLYALKKYLHRTWLVYASVLVNCRIIRGYGDSTTNAPDVILRPLPDHHATSTTYRKHASCCT